MRRGVRVRMKGLWLHPKTGKPYYRTRKGGELTLIALPADLPHDHPDFVAAWAEAARGEAQPKPKPKAGTIESTWNAVRGSEVWHSKSTGYRATLDRQAKLLIGKAGHVKATAVTATHVRKDIAAAPNPGARWRAWRLWATIGTDHGWLITDPTVGVRKPKEADGEHPCWTIAEIETFRAAYPIGSSPRAIMEICYWTGARISDAVRVGPRMVGPDGVLAFTQTKTKKPAYVPWSCALPFYANHMEPDRAMCKAAIAHIGTAFTFLQARDMPRSSKGAGQTIIKACRAIGLNELGAHGLRKARAVRLAEAGATAPQIAAWTGHRSLGEVTAYIAEMDRRAAVRG